MRGMLMKPYKRQTGFSLVELMIGLVIGLFILLGVVLVYVSSARTTATNEALSRVQESGRFGMFFLARDIRQAGFKSACQDNVNILLNTSSSQYDQRLFNLNDGVFGLNDTDDDFSDIIPDYVEGTDILIVKTAVNEAGVDIRSSNSRSGDIETVSINNIEAGTLLFIGDAQGCDLFQKSNAAGDRSLKKDATAGVPGNASVNWTRSYPVSARIQRFESTMYYIGIGVDGQPSLKRVTFNTGVATAPEELVNGIEDMQLSYGEDTNNDGGVDAYVTADAVTDWTDVLAIRVDLLATSLAQNVIDVPQTLPAPWDAMTDPGDGRIRRVFTSNVSIRGSMQ